MPGWLLYVGIGLSVHLAVLVGLPESGILRIAARFGVGAGEFSVVATVAALWALHRFARVMHRTGWRQGYFEGHFDGLQDAGAVWDEP